MTHINQEENDPCEYTIDDCFVFGEYFLIQMWIASENVPNK